MKWPWEIHLSQKRFKAIHFERPVSDSIKFKEEVDERLKMILRASKNVMPRVSLNFSYHLTLTSAVKGLTAPEQRSSWVILFASNSVKSK